MLAVGIERLGDVAHVAAQRALLARAREYLEEVVGETADHREHDDDGDWITPETGDGPLVEKSADA